MSEDGLKALEAELGAPTPAGVALLSADHQRDLAGAIRDVRHKQAAELAAAGDQAFDHIPKLLRTPIRKLFG